MKRTRGRVKLQVAFFACVLRVCVMWMTSALVHTVEWIKNSLALSRFTLQFTRSLFTCVKKKRQREGKKKKSVNDTYTLMQRRKSFLLLIVFHVTCDKVLNGTSLHLAISVSKFNSYVILATLYVQYFVLSLALSLLSPQAIRSLASVEWPFAFSPLLSFFFSFSFNTLCAPLSLSLSLSPV